MFNAEIFSVHKSGMDAVVFNDNVDDVASMLYNKDIRVIYKTDISCDAKKVTKALLTSQSSEEAPDYYIFANALDTTDNKSFKNLFYDFVKTSEEKLALENAVEGKTAKIKISSLGDLGNGYRGYCFVAGGARFIVLPQTSLAGVALVDMIDDATSRANKIFDDAEKTPTNGLAYIDGKPKKKKEGFFGSFIPHKTDSRNTKIRKWVVLASIVVFLFSLGYVINDVLVQPYINEQVNSEIQSIAYRVDTGSQDDSALSAQNWDALKKLNKEIVGWITIKDTKIDYPVLEHKGDDENGQYYLNHTYKKDYSVYGSIFLDYRSIQSTKSRNVIMHGHNMVDGSMFHQLLNYGDLTGNLDYYKKHPMITFNTPDGDSEWKIISIFKTSTLYDHGEFFNYMQGTFLSDAEYMNFLYNLRIRSLINTPVMVNETDQIITLSTCSYEFTNWRTVVVARKVRPGEKAEVNTEISTLNQNPVFPEVYYRSRGGTRPEVLTFKKAYEKGLINWYDGKGKLEGSEDLTATIAANPTQSPSENKTSSSPQTFVFYTVKFMNYDGSEYVSYSVREGDSVTPPTSAPKLPSDDYYNYTFTGWKTEGLDLDNVHYSMDIAPDFKATLKQQ